MTNRNRKLKEADRSTTINVRVTAAEKEKIEQYAAEYGGSISQYARSQLLSPSDGCISGKLRQQLVAMLCIHARIISHEEDEKLKQNLIEWERCAWESIR